MSTDPLADVQAAVREITQNTGLPTKPSWLLLSDYQYGVMEHEAKLQGCTVDELATRILREAGVALPNGPVRVYRDSLLPPKYVVLSLDPNQPPKHIETRP